MNQENSTLHHDQHQALSSYLDALLLLPEVMSTLVKETPSPSTQRAPHAFIPAPEAVVAPVAPRSGASLKCFVFNVGGIKLALPLARVSEIIDYAECSGAALPPLVLGSVAHEGRSVPVLDTAAIVLPNSNLAPSYQWLVMVDHGSYALACDSVDPGMEVAHDAVRWRTHLTKRRWLAGTLLQQRCALLDADEVYDQSADTVS